MKNINKSSFMDLTINKSKILDLLPEFINLVKANKVTKEDLLLIKDKIYQVKKNDLLDDFLLEYFKIKSLKYEEVEEILNYLNHPLSRRIIINLINDGVINKKNINKISKKNEDIKKYYDVINNKCNYDYDLEKLVKSYRNITCENKDWFQYHSNQIGCIPVLKEDFELFLFLKRDLKNQDSKKAIDYLILSNLRLARSLATTYAYKYNYSEVDELYENGVLGLINAVKNYDVYTGIKFSTYAQRTISRAINRAYYQNRLIPLPTDVAEGTNIRTDEDTLKAIDNVKKGFISLDVNLSDDSDDATFGDTITPDYDIQDNCEFYRPVEEVVVLHQLIEDTDRLISSCLTEEEKNMLISNICDGITQKEIVAMYSLNMTHQNVSLKIKKTIKKLQENKEFRQLLDYISSNQKEEVSAKMEKIIKEEIRNDDPYDYRQITKSRLKKNFGEFDFITDTDIEKSLSQIDEKIFIKKNLVNINNTLQNELMKKNVDNLKIIKLIKNEVSFLKNAMELNNLYEFRDELDFLVSVYDIYSDSKKSRVVDHMEIVYDISEMDKRMDPSPLLNYMSADISLYLKVANQVRSEEKEGIVDTLITVLANTNTQLYSLVRTACISYFKDSKTDLIEDMLKKVIETYDGKDLMLGHIKKVVKEEYEKINGTFIPPVRDFDDVDYRYEDEIKPGNYSELEYYGHYMKIWNVIATDDISYHNFLILKFKELKSFDELIDIFPDAYKYYTDAIKYINNDIHKNRKDDVKTR